MDIDKPASSLNRGIAQIVGEFAAEIGPRTRITTVEAFALRFPDKEAKPSIESWSKIE